MDLVDTIITNIINISYFVSFIDLILGIFSIFINLLINLILICISVIGTVFMFQMVDFIFSNISCIVNCAFRNFLISIGLIRVDTFISCTMNMFVLFIRIICLRRLAVITKFIVNGINRITMVLGNFIVGINNIIRLVFNTEVVFNGANIALSIMSNLINLVLVS